MHGAALTYPLFMPPHGGVIEFWPKDRCVSLQCATAAA
jgi:hypothetical protein